MKNYYAILEIEPDSGQDEIKAAFRRLAKENHPDRGGDSRNFRDIQEAYEILWNPALRIEYDSELSKKPFFGQPYREVISSAINHPADVFDDLVDVLGRRFGFAGEHGIDIDIMLTREEAARGVNLALKIPIEQICDSCFGFGGGILADCKKCGGVGAIENSRISYFRIEPGAMSGDELIIRNDELIINGRIVVVK